jgi:hypothetical protein
MITGSTGIGSVIGSQQIGSETSTSCAITAEDITISAKAETPAASTILFALIDTQHTPHKTASDPRHNWLGQTHIPNRLLGSGLTLLNPGKARYSPKVCAGQLWQKKGT